MRTPEAKKRLSRLHSKSRTATQHVKRMEKRLESAIQHRGVVVDDALHQDLCSTMAENSVQMRKHCPPGSFLRVLLGTTGEGKQIKECQVHEVGTFYD